jgi:hypothetical protein
LLADAINRKLPREIRDMIYSFCWEDTLYRNDHYKKERPWRASDVTQDELDGIGYSYSECGIPLYRRVRALMSYPMHYFVHPAYVGNEAAREAAEAFYRIAPAYIEMLDSCHLGEQIEYDDSFNVGITPRDLITSITFLLDMCQL